MSGFLILLGVAAVIAFLGWIVWRSTRGPSLPQGMSAGTTNPAWSSGSAGADASGSSSAARQTGFSFNTNPVAASGRPVNSQEKPMSYQEIEGRADQAHKRGDHNQAIELLNEALGIVHDTIGGDSTELARLLVKQGQVFQERDRNCSPDEIDCGEYLRALSIYEQRLGPNAEELLNVLDKLGSWYYQVGDSNRAETIARRADAIRSRRSAVGFSVGSLPVSPFDITFDCPDSEVNSLCRQGDEAFRKTDYEGGAARLEAAAERAYDKLGSDHECLVLLFHRIGRLYQVKDAEYRDDNGQHFTDPADNFQRALSILVARHGLNSRALLPVLLDLASFEDQRGDHNKADSYLGRIESIERNAR